LLEYGELLLFLLAAMTYMNIMQERNVFEALRAWLCSAGLSYRSILWIAGLLAFLESTVKIDQEVLSRHYKLKRKPFFIFLS